MVVDRNPRDISIPFPWIDGLTKRQQEEIYMDFLAVGRNGSGTRWRTIVIAASDSSEVAKSTADYVCSGTADDIKINAAISALEAKSGTAKLGRIVLLEGTYTLADQINIDSLTARSIAIEGMSGGVAINPTSTIGGTVLTQTNGGKPVFNLGGNSAGAGSTVTLENMTLIGASSTTVLQSRDMTLAARFLTIINSGAGGGIGQTSSTGGGNNSRIENCLVLCSGGGTGIQADVGSAVGGQCRITHNIVTVNGASSTGIKTLNNFSTTPSYHVSDNFVTMTSASNTTGILIAGTSTQYNVVANNMIAGTLGTGISIAGYHNNVVGNTIVGAVSGIVDGAFQLDYTLIVANNVNASSVGIRIGNTSCTGDAIIANLINGTPTTGISVGSNSSGGIVLGNGTAGAGTGISDGGTGTITDTHGIPAGGTTGQALEKTSNTDYAVAWTTLVDAVTSRIAALGDMLIGTGAGTVARLPLGTAAAGSSYAGRVLMTDPTAATGVKWGPTLTVDSVAPTSPQPGDVWLDTT